MDVSEVPRITCEDLKQLMDSGDNVIIIDTRQSSAYAAEHIQGAVNVYYNPSGDPTERGFMLSALPQDILLVPYCD